MDRVSLHIHHTRELTDESPCSSADSLEVEQDAKMLTGWDGLEVPTGLA